MVLVWLLTVRGLGGAGPGAVQWRLKEGDDDELAALARTPGLGGGRAWDSRGDIAGCPVCSGRIDLLTGAVGPGRGSRRDPPSGGARRPSKTLECPRQRGNRAPKRNIPHRLVRWAARPGRTAGRE